MKKITHLNSFVGYAQSSNIMRLQYLVRQMANQQVENMISTLPWILRGPIRMALFPARQTANMAANTAAGALGTGISMLQSTGLPGTGLLRSDFDDAVKQFPGAGILNGFNPAALGAFPTFGYGYRYPSFGQNPMMGSGMLTTQNPYPSSQQQAQQLVTDGVRYQRLRQAINMLLERFPQIASYFQSLTSQVGYPALNRPGANIPNSPTFNRPGLNIPNQGNNQLGSPTFNRPGLNMPNQGNNQVGSPTFNTPGLNIPNQGNNQGSMSSSSTLIPGMTSSRPSTSSPTTSGQMGSLGSAATAALNTLREGGNSAASTAFNGMQSIMNQMTGGQSSQTTNFKTDLIDLPAKEETKKERAKRETFAEAILEKHQSSSSS